MKRPPPWRVCYYSGDDDWLIRPWCTACRVYYNAVGRRQEKWVLLCQTAHSVYLKGKYVHTCECWCSVLRATLRCSLVCGRWVLPAGRLEPSHCSCSRWGLRGQLLPQPLCGAHSFDLLTPLHHLQHTHTHTHTHTYTHTHTHTHTASTTLPPCGQHYTLPCCASVTLFLLYKLVGIL